MITTMSSRNSTLTPTLSIPQLTTAADGFFLTSSRGQARYVASRKSWFIYDGTRWAPDEGNMATMEMCKTIGDALTRYAFEIKDEKERKGIFEVYNALDDAQLPQNHP